MCIVIFGYLVDVERSLNWLLVLALAMIIFRYSFIPPIQAAFSRA